MADGLRAEAAAARGLSRLYDYSMSSSARARVRARVRNKEKDALECNAVWNRAQRDVTHQVQCPDVSSTHWY